MTVRSAKKEKKSVKKHEKVFPTFTKISVTLIIILAMAFVCELARFSASHSVKNRVTKDLEATSWLQATMLK